MRTLIIYLILAFLLGLWLPIFGQNSNHVSQERVVALLSGAQDSDLAPALTSRTTQAERRIARLYLKQWMEELHLEAKEHRYRMPNLHPALDLLLSPYKGTNLYCILPAVDPHAEYVVLGAHYDSKLGCPGAVDNATGIALTIGVLQHLARLKNRQKNVLVVFFDQEEEELIGSQAFTKFLSKKQYPIHSVHTFDMAGWDEDENGEVELGAPSPALQNLYEMHAQRLNIPTYVTRGGSTDYQSFLAAGYPTIGVNEAFSKGDYSPYKDTPEDTYNTVNFNYLQHLTHYVREVIADLITTETISYGTN